MKIVPFGLKMVEAASVCVCSYLFPCSFAPRAGPLNGAVAAAMARVLKIFLARGTRKGTLSSQSGES